jgi:REP-associated tyrosine transposase
VNRSRLNEEEARVNSNKENLKHTRWECKYHVVFIPKYRRKVMYGWIRKELGPIMRELAQHKESEVELYQRARERRSSTRSIEDVRRINMPA